jgi:RNA-binding protein
VPSISTKQRAFLRSRAHALEPIVHVGSEGVTDAVCSAVDQALADHELVKVKLGRGFADDRHEGARALAEGTASDLTQLIGRVVVLYRPRPADDDRPRIVLPPQ